MFPTAADIYLHCLNDVSFLHVPTRPADREEMLSSKAMHCNKMLCLRFSEAEIESEIVHPS